MYDTDVLVVGAGPSGLTLAASLVSRGIATIVVDAQAAGSNTSRAAVVRIGCSALDGAAPTGAGVLCTPVAATTAGHHAHD